MYKNYLLKIGFIFGIIFLFIGMSFLPSTGKTIEEKKLNKLRISDINGIYYLRDDDPLNYLDEGSLLRGAPSEDEVTSCGLFIIFHFAEKDDYLENLTIYNIYYHIWQKSPESPLEGEIFDLGYCTSGAHDIKMNESITINTSKNNDIVNDYRLIQTMHYIDPDIAYFDNYGIYNFTIKLIGNSPNVRTYPDQYSFIILNLEDNTTLKEYDRDGDYLNDFDELFVFYTNPYDIDTDNDGVSDYFEYLAGTDPNDSSDFPIINNPPKKITITGPNAAKPNVSYQFTFNAVDPDGDNVKYIIDWGDTNTYSSIYVPSGTDVTLSHTWTSKGSYLIKAKAKDEFGIFGPETTKTIKVPKSKSINIDFLNFLKINRGIFPILQFLLKKFNLL